MKRGFKIVLKTILTLGVLIVAVFGILYLIYNKPLPEGKEGQAADELAYKMLSAIGYESYKNTRFIEWSFKGIHQYKWDKANGKVSVKWDDYTVNLNLNDTASSIVSKKNEELSAKESRDITNTAWGYFNNDSFWVVAPFKAFDKGTVRSLVSLEGGSEALLVYYSNGGTTPGDTYLWKLLPNGFPESYQMWVKIIPIGGLEATWDDWKVMESGVFLPTSHQLGPMNIDLGDVKAYN